MPPPIEVGPFPVNEDTIDSNLDLDLDFQLLAQCLTDLSRPGQTPQGVSEVSGGASDVEVKTDSFLNNEWLQILLGIQPWLGLGSPLPEDGTPDSILVAFFAQIPPGKPEGCFNLNENGVISVTPIGIDRLSSRLERAVEFRNSFEEGLDEGQSLKDATAIWSEAWDDENSQIRRPISDINAKVDKWKILNFRDMAREGKFELNPSYQRDVVWSNKDSVMLIESILRGIPLPSVIFSEDAEGKYQIVDGKQRLTAILRFIGWHPTANKFITSKHSTPELFQKDFPKFFKDHRIKPVEQAEHFLPFKLGRFTDSGDPLAPISQKYYSQIREMKIRRGGKDERIRDIFESPSSNYEIPVLIFTETRIQDIHQVFGIYNRQGMKLNAEELRNAIYHHLYLTRLLLGLSGDRADPNVIAELVAFLPVNLREGAAKVGSTLGDKGFGTARFKRTKVLSWVVAIMVHSPNPSDGGGYVYPATANHINSMLEKIQEDASAHILYGEAGLTHLAEDIQLAVQAHQDAIEAWPPKLISKKGFPGKWEELPLVATLLGTLILVASGNLDSITGKTEEIRAYLDSERARPPKKTQNKTQWQFISRVVIDILMASGADANAIDLALKERYGYSCIPILTTLGTEYSYE